MVNNKRSCYFVRNRLEYNFSLNPFRMKTPNIFILKRKKPLFLSSNWQHNFFYFHYKSVKLDVLCRQNKIYEHLAILSNLKSCQFAPRIAIFNFCICCQFEDSQIILPKTIPMSHHNI